MSKVKTPPLTIISSGHMSRSGIVSFRSMYVLTFLTLSREAEQCMRPELGQRCVPDARSKLQINRVSDITCFHII